jgi:hypothetical protein
MQTNCHASPRGYMMNVSQELTSHIFGTVYLFYLSSHNHSTTILSFIYLLNTLNSMECLLSYSIKTSDTSEWAHDHVSVKTQLFYKTIADDTNILIRQT